MIIISDICNDNCCLCRILLSYLFQGFLISAHHNNLCSLIHIPVAQRLPYSRRSSCYYNSFIKKVVFNRLHVILLLLLHHILILRLIIWLKHGLRSLLLHHLLLIHHLSLGPRILHILSLRIRTLNRLPILVARRLRIHIHLHALLHLRVLWTASWSWSEWILLLHICFLIKHSWFKDYKRFLYFNFISIWLQKFTNNKILIIIR